MKLREQAYDSFTENLLSRRILPGQFITQRELSDLTAMPLGAIRELIPRLEADGLLKTVPQRGMQITHIDLDLIRNAFQLRLILESEAARQFALTATDEECAQVKNIHQEILDDAENGITEELVERAQNVDWAFHDTLIDHLQNPIISDIYRVNSIKIRLIRQELAWIRPELLVSVFAEHMAIIAALKSRDPDKAEVALAKHLTNSRNRALQL